MITLLLYLSIFSTSWVQGLRLEAEDGVYAGGVTFANSIPGFSGRGYVTTFVNDSSQVTVMGLASNGPYEVRVGYHSSEDKGFNFQVNDEKGSGTFQTTGNNWTSISAGKFLLHQTQNTITISKGWGWVEHGANATGLVESVISWALSFNSIVTLSWHWNAPCDLIDQPGKEWWRGFYTTATTYDIAKALETPTSVEYTKLIGDLDAIGVQLVKFQKNNTPLLWRPLHEASGGWFWWGAKGPEAFKQLWRLMYTRFTRDHGLHHLIWVYTAAVGQAEWYPGDDVVDVVSLDIYTDPNASMSGEWEGILKEFNGKKVVTLSETGNLPIPEKIRDLGVWWSWFSVWSGMIKPEPVDLVKEVYSDPSIVTVDQLPDWRHYH